MKVIYVAKQKTKILEFSKQGPPGPPGAVPAVLVEPEAPKSGGIMYLLNGDLWFKDAAGNARKISCQE